MRALSKKQQQVLQRVLELNHQLIDLLLVIQEHQKVLNSLKSTIMIMRKKSHVSKKMLSQIQL